MPGTRDVEPGAYIFHIDNYQHRRIVFVSSLKLVWKVLKSEVAKGVVWRGGKSLASHGIICEWLVKSLHIEGLWGARGQVSRNARWLRSSGRWDVCCKILIFTVLQPTCGSFGEVCLFARALARCFRPTLPVCHVWSFPFAVFLWLATFERPGLCELHRCPSWRRNWTMPDRQSYRTDQAVFIRVLTCCYLRQAKDGCMRFCHICPFKECVGTWCGTGGWWRILQCGRVSLGAKGFTAFFKCQPSKFCQWIEGHISTDLTIRQDIHSVSVLLSSEAMVLRFWHLPTWPVTVWVFTKTLRMLGQSSRCLSQTLIAIGMQWMTRNATWFANNFRPKRYFGTPSGAGGRFGRKFWIAWGINLGSLRA